MPVSVQVAPGSIDTLTGWGFTDPLVAVDMVFGGPGHRKEGLVVCGSNEPPIKRNYAQVVTRLAELAIGSARLGLILEAPLSYGFDEKGCPTARGAFEGRRQRLEGDGELKWTKGGKPSYSGFAWHLQAAQSARAAAVFTLRDLISRLEMTSVGLPDDGVWKIVVFEGFVVGGDGGNKPAKGVGSQDDADARALADLAEKTRCQEDLAENELIVPAAARLVSVLELAGVSQAEGAHPPIVLVPGGNFLIAAVERAVRSRIARSA